METILQKAISAVERSEKATCKWIQPNDTGSTGSHAAGFHFGKATWPLYFKIPGFKGEIKKSGSVRIRWQDDIETDSEFTYYGQKTRDEYRLTRFGRGFPFLNSEYDGDLLVLAKIHDRYYEAYILSTDEEFDSFFAALNISATHVHGIIPKCNEIEVDDLLLKCFQDYLSKLKVEFPSTLELASRSRFCFNTANTITTDRIRNQPDQIIMGWLESEYQLFKTIENDRYGMRIRTAFATVEELVEVANSILNRRKSRAGSSLEHHVAEVFNIFEVRYETQKATEKRKKPDFVFPSIANYHDSKFKADNLLMLACKTTCKDRWRQVLSEADRIRTKHLFTLQQGISRNQLEEMYDSGVCLVVPQENKKNFPKLFQSRILTLYDFIRMTPKVRRDK